MLLCIALTSRAISNGAFNVNGLLDAESVPKTVSCWICCKIFDAGRVPSIRLSGLFTMVLPLFTDAFWFDISDVGSGSANGAPLLFSFDDLFISASS